MKDASGRDCSTRNQPAALTGVEYLVLVGELRGMPDMATGARPSRLTPKPIRKKILLAAALLHNPDLILTVERVCSRVVSRHKGKVVANDSIERLGR